MNKYIIFICFLSIIYLTNSLSNDTYSMVYDIIVDIMKGMSKNETFPICSIKFKENKEDALEIFIQLIDFFIEGRTPDWWSLILLFLPLNDKIQPCNLYNFVEFVFLLMNYSVELIQNVGLNFVKKALDISNNLEHFFDKFSFEYIGKALSLAFNSYI